MDWPIWKEAVGRWCWSWVLSEQAVGRYGSGKAQAQGRGPGRAKALGQNELEVNVFGVSRHRRKNGVWREHRQGE